MMVIVGAFRRRCTGGTREEVGLHCRPEGQSGIAPLPQGGYPPQEVYRIAVRARTANASLGSLVRTPRPRVAYGTANVPDSPYHAP